MRLRPERRPLKNIFSDRSSLVLRALLREPGRQWKLKELAAEGITPILAGYVLERAEAYGFVHRVQAGYKSYAELVDPKSLLETWSRSYRIVDLLPMTFQFRGADFLPALRDVLMAKGVGFALTLFSASRRIAPYVKNTREFVYLDASPSEILDILGQASSQLGLARAEQRWNVCFFSPFYRRSIFKHVRLLKDYPAVDDLQLYLDLTGYPPVGYEEANFLVQHWKKGGAAPWASQL